MLCTGRKKKAKEESFAYQKFVLMYANYITAGVSIKQMLNAAVIGCISFISA